jgi:transcriptional regulator with GAF, ATPase, and Fis domain
MNPQFDEMGTLANFEDYFPNLRQRLTELSVTHWGESEKLVFIGESPVFLNTLNQLKIVAALTCPILFIGESGVGKELFARARYLLSERAGKPFMVVNCAEFQSPSLLVSGP